MSGLRISKSSITKALPSNSCTPASSTMSDKACGGNTVRFFDAMILQEGHVPRIAIV